MIYLDHSSATFIEEEVLETLLKVESTYFANPDALHDFGLEVKKLQNQARKRIATLLKVEQEEIIFTSGGCESNTLALKGYIEKYKHLKNKVCVACGEHSSVMATLHSIEGIEIVELALNENGNIDMETLEKHVDDQTLIVSIAAIQNEFGAIRPIEQYAQFLKKHHVVFHVDAVQAIGKHPFDYSNVDLVSISAHKLHGPKGIGALIKKKHIQLQPIIYGGQQELNLRGGTSSVALQVAFAKALRIALDNQRQYVCHMKTLNTFLREQLAGIPDVHINSSEHATDYILNFSICVLPSQVILNALSKNKIYVSATASCVTKRKPVSTIACFQQNPSIIDGVVRVSLSYRNTLQELETFVLQIQQLITSYKTKK